MASLASLGNELYTGRRSFGFIPRRRTWFTIAAALVLVSILLLLLKPLNLGIEFTGGSQFTISGTASLEQDPAHEVLTEAGADQAARVSSVGAETLRVQTEELTSEETGQVREALAEAYDVPVGDVTSTFIGPTWGEGISQQALQGLVVFLVLVSVVLAAYFRTWKMAAAALIALLHDLIASIGLYALVGFEVTPATVIGFLTILGYSLYDTVVIFDKVRENTTGLYDQQQHTYAEAANLAVNQTLVRSINTSLTSVLPVGSILFVGALLLGAGTLRDIALALFVGMIVSTLSSLFVATPLLVQLRQGEEKLAEHTAKVLDKRAERRAAREGVEGGADPAEDLPGHGVVAGSHQGIGAQPRRRRRGQR